MKKYHYTKAYYFIISLVFLTINSYCTQKISYSQRFPIVKCAEPSTYEQILMTILRNKNSTQEEFRYAANKLIEMLVHKVFDCLETEKITINTPVAECLALKPKNTFIQLVSVMRSGDVPLNIFSTYFPSAAINKILIQRNENTAEPIFIYKKLSPTIGQAEKIIITEPMIATGGTLVMVIELLKKYGIDPKDIIITAICAAPEGLEILQNLYPEISIVLTIIDDCLNEKKYIVPGIGDFGDRYFGT